MGIFNCKEINNSITGERQTRHNNNLKILSKLAVGLKKFWRKDFKNNSHLNLYKDQLALLQNCEHVKVPLLNNDILKNKNIDYYSKRNYKKYADMQQLLTQDCTAVINIANNCLEGCKFNKIVNREHWSHRLYLLGEHLPGELRKDKSKCNPKSKFLEATNPERQKARMIPTKIIPGECLNQHGRKKNQSGSEHPEQRQGQGKSLHRFQKELIPKWVIDLTYYLKNRIVQTKAGCIVKQLSKWERITSDIEMLSTVYGFPLNISERIDYKSYLTPNKVFS